MSESPESSYYEIALSNRQVLIMFVVLLSCMVVAFLSGVWIGNKNPDDIQPQLAEAAEASQQSPTEQLGELNFFSDQQDSPPTEPPLAQVAEAARPDTTLREEVGRNLQVQSSPATPPVKTLLEKPEAFPATEPSSTSTAASLVTDGPFVIQVFSSRDQIQADRLVNKLVNGGYPAFAISEDVEGNTVYRVRIGPYQDRRRAEQVAVLVKKSFKVDTWITR
ncbi:MAG: SPOR domain-containing protein [Thermoanaerobaculia bacterium]